MGKANANTRFRVAIIGTGRIAQVMTDSIRRHRDLSVVAIGSRDVERARLFASRNNIQKYYGSYDELIASEGYDLIYIATVNSTHYDIASKCLNNNKPVLVEKPMCLDSDQVRRLVRLSHDMNTFLAEAMPLRYSCNMRKVIDYIRACNAGDASLMISNLGINCWQVERINDCTLGGGALYDLGVYGLTIYDMIYNGCEPTQIYSEALVESSVDSVNTITLSAGATRAICYNSVRHDTVCDAVIYGNGWQTRIMKAYNARFVLCYAGMTRMKCFIEGKNSNYINEVRACRESLRADLLETPCYNHDSIIHMHEMVDRIRMCWKNN